MHIRFPIAFAAVALAASTAHGACVNKFTRRSEAGSRHVVTLLTGKLTFQDAQALAAAINEGKAKPLEWIDGSGKSIAKQFGELKVVRPMPVGCDDNPSGVVMIAVFPSAQTPSKKMIVKLDAGKTVAFEEQN